MNVPNSFDNIVSRLRSEFPGVRLLALGQTVYWDEPVKAVLRRLLDEHLPETEMLVGIHDADYFSKVPTDVSVPKGWSMLPHNDGAARDLWIATGEISRLFGSETVPSRDDLTACSVQIDKIAKDFSGGRDSLIETATEAWGWRGLAHVDGGSEIAADVKLRDALPHLLELLDWGFAHTLDSLSEADALAGRRIADELLSEVQDYADEHPDAAITDMYRDFMGRFYAKLLGRSPQNLRLTTASEVFTFNRSTAGLRRFQLLGLFLDPKMRVCCQDAYDLAVQDSDAYTLDRFSDGAIPFDLVVLGRGRGTICLRDGEVFIDFDEPVTLPVSSPPSTVEELAALIEDHFGSETVLIGKALTLVLMMASEFIYVLHEQASAYVPLCEKMAVLMEERGAGLPFYPLLRIGYHTWDSLAACRATFRLPGHLAAAFRQGEMTSAEFADSWQITVRKQEELLEKLRLTSNMDDLLAFLVEHQDQSWAERIMDYMTAHTAVRELSESTQPMKDESIRLRDLSHRIKQDVQELEMRKGEHFRSAIKPLKDELDAMEVDGGGDGLEAARLRRELEGEEGVRGEIEAKIDALRQTAMDVRTRSQELKREVQSLERGEEILKAREVLKTIEREAELARLWLVRDAVLVSKGLTYTDHRPSAWWFMLVDPQMKWFDRVAQTAEFRFEEIKPTG